MCGRKPQNTVIHAFNAVSKFNAVYGKIKTEQANPRNLQGVWYKQKWRAVQNTMNFENKPHHLRTHFKNRAPCITLIVSQVYQRFISKFTRFI